MKQQSRYRFTESLIYSVLWAFVFTMPIMLSFDGVNFNMVRVQHEIIRLIPFFLLFIIHNAFLFGLLSNNKKALYFSLGSVIIIALSIVAANNEFFFRLLDLPLPQRPPGPEKQNIIARYFYNLIFCILVAGLNVAIKMSFRWMESQKNFEELQKENYKNELALLKHQVSPHFFMNTLNNIHAMIDFDSEKAKTSIVKLSKLMRILLRDADNGKYSLADEIAFLNDYIGLMRIRLHDDVEVRFEYPEKIPDVQIPTLLFISLLENAFKHGIRSQGKSFIHMKIGIDGNTLHTNISNSVGDSKPADTDESHIGLNNSRKRFELLYGNSHTFEVIDSDDIFEINISLPIS